MCFYRWKIIVRDYYKNGYYNHYFESNSYAFYPLRHKRDFAHFLSVILISIFGSL